MAVGQSEWVVDVAEAEFERAVLERSRERPVVVDFWAPWCQPCRMLGPVLERLARERAGEFILAKVNIDEAPGPAARYGVEAIPAVQAFRNGQPVVGFVGLLPEGQLREFLERVLPSEADRLAARAATLESSDAAAAEATYRQALDRDRDQPEALVGLARILAASGRDAEARELLDRTVPGGELGAEAERLRAVLDLRERARGFGTEDELRRRVEAEPANARALYELGCVTAAAGRYPEALQLLLSAAEKDRKLASAAVKEAMVRVFHAVGVRSALADEYRDRLSRLLY